MAAWRQKAIALFPDLRHDLELPDSSPYTAFFELLPRVIEAHRTPHFKRREAASALAGLRFGAGWLNDVLYFAGVFVAHFLLSAALAAAVKAVWT